MNDFDLDRLGEVWRAEPDAAEMAALQRSAETVRRRARWSQLFDAALAIVVSGIILLLVLSSPRIETALVGSATILILLGNQVRQRRLRAIELKALTGTAEDMLDQSITRLRTTLRHNRFSLLAVGPVAMVTILFAYTTRGSLESALSWIRDDTGLRILWIGLWLLLAAVALVSLARAMRRHQRELDRLIKLRETYHREREASDS